jgi:2-polyprenyl-6-methoxyphenol hydroxylase-like FAD-dependent oxidoreductase
MVCLCIYPILGTPGFLTYCWRCSIQLEQGTVTTLLEENGTVKGVQYKNKSGEELKAYAPLTIVCDGCFSNLRRALCSPTVQFSHYAYY